MNTYIFLGAAVVVILGLGYLLIKAVRSSAKKEGEASVRAEVAETQVEVERDMTNAVLEPTSPDETKDKLRKGEF